MSEARVEDLVRPGDEVSPVSVTWKGEWWFSEYYTLRAESQVIAVRDSYVQTWDSVNCRTQRWFASVKGDGNLYFSPSWNGEGPNGYGKSGLVKVVHASKG